MQRRKKAPIRRAETSLFRRIVLPAIGWALLGLGSILATNPERLNLLLSGDVAPWRLALFAAALVTLALAVSMLNDWRRRRLSSRR